MAVTRFFGILLIVMTFGMVSVPMSAPAQSYSASYKFLKAIKKLDYQKIRVAIGKGVNINTRDYDDRTTPLIIATKMKETPLVRYLLGNGAKPNLFGKDGRTPLVIAADIGDRSIVDVLIKAGADINLGDNDGTTPLIAAVLARKENIIRLLLKAGADYDVEDYSGRTALQHAIDTRRRRIIKILQDAGAH